MVLLSKITLFLICKNVTNNIYDKDTKMQEVETKQKVIILRLGWAAV